MLRKLAVGLEMLLATVFPAVVTPQEVAEKFSQPTVTKTEPFYCERSEPWGDEYNNCRLPAGVRSDKPERIKRPFYCDEFWYVPDGTVLHDTDGNPVVHDETTICTRQNSIVFRDGVLATEPKTFHLKATTYRPHESERFYVDPANTQASLPRLHIPRRDVCFPREAKLSDILVMIQNPNTGFVDLHDGTLLALYERGDQRSEQLGVYRAEDVAIARQIDELRKEIGGLEFEMRTYRGEIDTSRPISRDPLYCTKQQWESIVEMAREQGFPNLQGEFCEMAPVCQGDFKTTRNVTQPGMSVKNHFSRHGLGFTNVTQLDLEFLGYPSTDRDTGELVYSQEINLQYPYGTYTIIARLRDRPGEDPSQVEIARFNIHRPDEATCYAITMGDQEDLQTVRVWSPNIIDYDSEEGRHFYRSFDFDVRPSDETPFGWKLEIEQEPRSTTRLPHLRHQQIH